MKPSLLLILFALTLLLSPELHAQSEGDREGWNEMRHPILSAAVPGLFAGENDVQGLRFYTTPLSENLFGYELSLYHPFTSEWYEVPGPMGSSILGYRGSGIEGRLQGGLYGEPVQLDLVGSIRRQNDPERTYLTMARLRGGYRGEIMTEGGGSTHQLLVDGLISTNSIALGLNNPSQYPESRGIEGPQTFTLYVGSLAGLRISPDLSPLVEPYVGIDGHWEIGHRRFTFLYGGELRHDGELRGGVRSGFKFGWWRGAGLVIDWEYRQRDRSIGIDDRGEISGEHRFGIGYEFSR